MDKKIGIVFTSRNNYELFDNWCKKTDTTGYEILNIDEDSTDEQKILGKSICKKHGITYLDREERGMLWNLLTACNYFENLNKEYILYFSHDCYPKTDNFFNKLNTLVSEKDLAIYGAIGFNILHDDREISEWNGDSTPLHHVARTPLEPGDKYYRSNRYWPSTRVRYSDKFKKPFAVESIMWTAGLLNINQYKTHIIPTSDYHMFHSWDDMCFQFLNKNIYNIVLPEFCLAHEQRSKLEFGIPKDSPNNENGKREHYFSKFNHLEVFEDRWGFNYSDRNTFEAVKDSYKDTLLWEFYNHDPIDGPLKSFDI
tara:strand:- start:14220 stop:15155 length:936 start_codon:yes stop_codon:yes gene_type:complete